MNNVLVDGLQFGPEKLHPQRLAILCTKILRLGFVTLSTKVVVVRRGVAVLCECRYVRSNYVKLVRDV